ncbi:MAG: HEAT repeat domain-containing protein [Planctomycetes bacterium]|nr:HEAT repeat domain-containing protein [Planctomycetota bacterium]
MSRAFAAAAFALFLGLALASSVRAEGEGQKAKDLIEKLLKAKPDDFDPIAEELQKLGEPAVAELIGLLKSEDAKVYRKAYRALAAFHEEAVYPLAAALAGSSPRVRFQLAELLGGLRDVLALDALMELVTDATRHPTPPREAGPVRRLCDTAYLAFHRIQARESVNPQEYHVLDAAARDQSIEDLKKWWGNRRDRVMVPRWIEALASPHLGCRKGAYERLSSVVKDGPAYDPAAAPEPRKAAAEAWGKWLEANRARFETGAYPVK